MSKMTSEERQKRRDRVAADALESVAKTEQFNFRVNSETIKRLYKTAAEQKKPVGALVREWVLERLNKEQKAPSSADLMQEIHALREQTMSGFERARRRTEVGKAASEKIAKSEQLNFYVEEQSIS